ncbi:MAG: PadR family transcriptional regulator [Chloroflexi bacterium SZAS-1]|nr:PadR family transcriptional regulator [Chloroflexi bacterium SZAS-1]
MANNPLSLGEFEELVLLAIQQLYNNAYGMTIRQRVEDASERMISIGAIYTTLERLEIKGFVSSRQGEATPERGGRAKRYFTVEGAGVQALTEAQRTRDRLRHRGITVRSLVRSAHCGRGRSCSGCVLPIVGWGHSALAATTTPTARLAPHGLRLLKGRIDGRHMHRRAAEQLRNGQHLHALYSVSRQSCLRCC